MPLLACKCFGLQRGTGRDRPCALLAQATPFFSLSPLPAFVVLESFALGTLSLQQFFVYIYMLYIYVLMSCEGAQILTLFQLRGSPTKFLKTLPTAERIISRAAREPRARAAREPRARAAREPKNDARAEGSLAVVEVSGPLSQLMKRFSTQNGRLGFFL